MKYDNDVNISNIFSNCINFDKNLCKWISLLSHDIIQTVEYLKQQEEICL